MTPATTPAFPAGHVLAGWGRQLDPLRPQALWMGLVLLHHVEVLVRTARPRPLDPLAQMVLKTLSLWPGATTVEVDRRLQLGAATGGILRRLQAEGLAQSSADTWTASVLGLQAFAQGEFPQFGHERRSFHFVESGRAGNGPHYLRLRSHQACSPWHPAADWQFRAEALKECVRRPAEWKRQHDFPAEVADVVDHGPDPAAAALWERVMFDRPERLWAVLVQTAGEAGGERLLGFAVRTDGWVLQADEPAFVLHADWRAVFPQLAEPPAPDAWREAWLAWCQAYSLASAEAAACGLELRGPRVTVTASRRLIERLRSSRSEALRGEAWLLAGDGPLRAAAQVELTEAAGDHTSS